MSEQVTMAGALAALYGEPADTDSAPGEVWTPTMEELEEALLLAVEQANLDLAAAIAAEMRRLNGEPQPKTTAGQLYGAKAGLWRLH